MTKNCVTCGAEFETFGNSKYCMSCPNQKEQERNWEKRERFCKHCHESLGSETHKQYHDECYVKHRQTYWKKNYKLQRLGKIDAPTFKPLEECWLDLMVAVIRSCRTPTCDGCLFEEFC